ncbi:hypothetical protein [Mycobacterium avium]|uniref:hypothetical protein n=1 Tax=Mycobacterium avium TaxID=1764 RepID=UPI000A9FA5D5|nr:hypothetical protein [Mycobacterium avium]
MADPVTMLRPYPDSVGVQVHPHVDGDVVSEVFVDAATGGRYIILRQPSAALRLGEDLLEATTDPEIARQADAVRERRERDAL